MERAVGVIQHSSFPLASVATAPRGNSDGPLSAKDANLDGMSLIRLRRSMRPMATMLLILCLFGGLPHVKQDDAGCEPSGGYVGAHDETRHQLRAPGQIDVQQHCAICHWISLRAPRTPSTVWVVPAASPSLLNGRPSRLVLAPVFESLPARAPPSA